MAVSTPSKEIPAIVAARIAIRLGTTRSMGTGHQHINWPKRKDPAAKTAGYIRPYLFLKKCVFEHASLFLS